jgi:GH35 family endo-1,4-beta-xylanase
MNDPVHNRHAGRLLFRAGRAFGYFLLLMLCGGRLLAQNLFSNPGFESGTTGWSGNSSATFTSSTAKFHTGTHAAYLTNRTATWNGIVQNVAGVLQNTNTYYVSAWVLIDNATNQPANLTLQKTDASGLSYTHIAACTGNSNTWTQMTGNFTLNIVGVLTNLTIYIEGPGSNVSFYADDFVLTNVPPYDWKSNANVRIEQIRKRDVRVQITDSNGLAVAGAAIQVRQTKHQFAFGTAINGNVSNPQYAAFVRTNFEWAVMENESKWYANEPSRSNVTYTAADTLTNFCYTNGIKMRGHCLFWAVDGNVQSWVTNLTDADLRTHLTNRLNSAVNHFKGTFGAWDVNNEMLHGNYYGNRLGNGINSWMFQYARSLNTNLQLFVNDYNVVSGGETDAYKLQIQNLIASNAVVGGIGCQGHFGSTVDPTLTEQRLDNLAQLNIPIWITEYDSLNTNEVVRADNLETLYRMAFSKQAVDGIMMWGFWAGSHWRGSNAVIVNLDWTVNAAGLRYKSLLAEWTTTTNGAADAGGSYYFRGFHGDYDVTITPPGGVATVRRITVTSGAGTNLVTLVVPPSVPPNFSSGAIRRLADKNFSLTATGSLGAPYRFWANTNLAAATNTWTLISSGNITSNPFTLYDLTATNFPRRFYRFSSP